MKSFLVLISLLFLFGCSASCISGNCNNGYGTSASNDGGKFVGEWKNGLANGWGTAIYPDGKKYVGEWKNDLPHGQGTLTYADGRIIQGIWQSGNFLMSDDSIAEKEKEKAEKEKEAKFASMLAKQETCKTLGWKIGTEKNGECVLKLMELETQVAESTQTIINNNTSSNNATVNALAETQRQMLIQQQSQALMNMGAAMINSGKPKINCRQTITGFSCY